MSLSTLSGRANAVFAFFTSICFMLAIIISISGPVLLWISPLSEAQMPVISVRTEDIIKTRTYFDKTSQEWGLMRFNLTADLNPLFNWNTKQLFIYLVIEYPSSANPFNQVVIWDDIIPSKYDAEISLIDEPAEYPFSDLSHKIQGIKGNVSLHYNIVPYIGAMLYGKSGSFPLTIQKTTKASAK